VQEAMRSDTGPVPTIGSDGNPLLKSLEPSAVSPAIDGIDLRTAIVSKLTYHVGKSVRDATDADWYAATCLALRDREVDAFHAAARRSTASKRVCYLSMEFLIGQRLPETLGNLGLAGAARSALSELGVDLDRLFKIEPDPALGNGGLGRLAACFMESMATLDIPAVGYGIRYDYGLFRQAIVDGWQRERPDNWLSSGFPWEFVRHHHAFSVKFGGDVELVREGNAIRHIWRPADAILAVAHDILVVGWRGRRANLLRLWRARAAEPLELDAFNDGKHVEAQAAKARADAISKVLYPSDDTPEGRELRLRQEYFFTSASLQDLVCTHLGENENLHSLPERAAVQLNDTHPALAVPELMRILVDEHDLPWSDAWHITTNVLNYTNHTLLPEALETWPVPLLERLLPRHLQIIYLINWLHLKKLSEEGRLGDHNVGAVSLIAENGGRRVRMGHLAFLGSRKVNGVSALHTELMRETVFRDLHVLYPDRILNKTNGITFRRWLHRANPGLTHLLVDAVGERVLDDADALRGLEKLSEDPAFQARIAAERIRNKEKLAYLIRERIGLEVDSAAIFDVQVKRIHEYKRQLLNILEIVALLNAMREQPDRDWVPRVKILAGKAAPSYTTAKLIIKLANDVARVVNGDPSVAGRLKVAFLPNYNVSLAESTMPAADLSEQISTAGLEASGTGNMKLALNGALTIGTLDGANIEIRDRVGPDNMFIFGLTAQEVERRRGYDPHHTIEASPRLSLALKCIEDGLFSQDDPARYRGLVEALRLDDRFMVVADFESYWAKQREVDRLWRDPFAWWRKSILNTARMGWFSSDRTIREYAEEIWGVPAA
jgi:glycogen phosphorylase